MEELSAQTRNTKAAIYGVIAGIVYMATTTVAFTQVSNAVVFNVAKAGGYLLLFVTIGFLTAQIKKANGGYLEFKKAFGAVFIMILIASTLNFIYNYVYISYIDPNYAYKLKTATLATLQKVKPEEVSKAAANFDQQIAESKKFNLGNNLLALSMSILYNCLPGLIMGLIVKKNKPELVK